MTDAAGKSYKQNTGKVVIGLIEIDGLKVTCEVSMIELWYRNSLEIVGLSGKWTSVHDLFKKICERREIRWKLKGEILFVYVFNKEV